MRSLAGAPSIGIGLRKRRMRLHVMPCLVGHAAVEHGHGRTIGEADGRSVRVAGHLPPEDYRRHVRREAEVDEGKRRARESNPGSAESMCQPLSHIPLRKPGNFLSFLPRASPATISA